MNIFISAHLDDAVLSCGQTIAAMQPARVITIFSGMPKNKHRLSDYDKKTGFKTSEEAVNTRKAEDRIAQSILGSDFIHLDFKDHQYNQPSTFSDIVDTVREYVNDADRLFFPLGLLHPDHETAHKVGLEIMSLSENIPEYYIYEDLPHRVLWPQETINKLSEYNLEYARMNNAEKYHKIRALMAYKSQINTGDLDIDYCLVPERFWRLK